MKIGEIKSRHANSLAVTFIILFSIGLYSTGLLIIIYSSIFFGLLLIGSVVLATVCYFYIKHLSFLKDFKQYINVQNESRYKSKGFYVDPIRAHYLVGIFVFNRNYIPAVGSFKDNIDTAKFIN